MSLDGANFTMMKRDVAYYKAAYKRQLAVTNQLRTELDETHQHADALVDLKNLYQERHEHKIGEITDANNLLRSKVAELERKIDIKDHVMSCRARTTHAILTELAETRRDLKECLDEVDYLSDLLDTWK